MKSLEWKNGKIRFIDQTRLPTDECYVETDDELVIARAIKNLSIRGAPLIGIAAAYAVALAVEKITENNPAKISASFDKVINGLAGTRPTAVNLFWALNRQKKAFDRSRASGLEAIKLAVLEEAHTIHEEDSEMCDAIGKYGAELLPKAAVVLTHCNTGMLATGGIGTALGIIHISWEQHKLKHVYIDETRPLLQGARLSAWELKNLGIPFTLITDSTAGFLMQQGEVNTVLVGADRIAANGDVTNKVGTYGLAVLAKHHGIPMYVAAPTSSIDLETPDGKAVPIEQRSSDEVTKFFGKQIAPEDVDVYSPAFDITPRGLITAIITERGVLKSPNKESIINLKRQMNSGAI